MILKFSFKIISTSLFLENFLLKELEENNLEGKLIKNKNQVDLFVKASQEELEEFADKLSQDVPVSLFLKDTKVEVVEEYPKENYELPSYPKRDFPFCPKCLKKAQKEFNPFVKCDVCGYNGEYSNLVYKNFEKIIKNDNQNIFKNLANALVNGGIIKIKTFSGYRVVSLLNEKNFKNISNDFEILSVDLNAINDLFALSKGEIIALGSFEKPILRLPVNQKIISQYDFFKKVPNVKIRLSDDLILELICEEVKKMNESYILITKPDNSKKYNIELDFDGEVKELKTLEVMVLDDGTTLLVDGDRSIIPKVNNGYEDIKLGALSQNYITINENNLITTYAKGTKKSTCDKNFTLREGELSYEASHGAFNSILAECNLYNKTIIGAYFSKENSDKIMLNSPKFGLVDYISFDFKLPKDTNELFENIKQINETANKLVNNYLKAIPKSLNKTFIYKDKISNIYKLWGIIAVLLGIQEDGNVEEGAQKILYFADSFAGRRGPRIDYKLKREDEKSKLNILKVIRTIMSFRLTQMDFLTLSFGILESFTEFISNLVDDIQSNYDVIDGVCFNGSLFQTRKLTNNFYKITKKNYKMYMNQEFVLDDMNLGFGIINAACKK